MFPYKGADGIGCCGDVDCIEATVEILDMRGTIAINGAVITIPLKGIHPSEDGKAYWCFKNAQCKTYGPAGMGCSEYEIPPITRENTRCAFFVLPSSQ